MVMLLGTAIGVLVVAVVAGARHRARNRWVSPYTHLARSMRVVTRTEPAEFHAAAGLVRLRPAQVGPRADVVDIGHARSGRDRQPAAV